MLHPIFQAEVPGFPLPPCDLAINAGGAMWVLRAAFEHLNAWVTDGTSPPVSDRIATVGGSPTGELILDEYGNPIGGIRTPHVDVPVATLRGSGNSPGFCSLFGTTVPFSAETLAQLYRTRGEFVSKWSRSVDSAVRAGFIRRGDARHLKISAARSTVGQSSVACTILRSRNPERGAINHGNTAIHSCIRRSLPRAIR
jgi:hypothetical protein